MDDFIKTLVGVFVIGVVILGLGGKFENRMEIKRFEDKGTIYDPVPKGLIFKKVSDDYVVCNISSIGKVSVTTGESGSVTIGYHNAVVDEYNSKLELIYSSLKVMQSKLVLVNKDLDSTSSELEMLTKAMK